MATIIKSDSQSTQNMGNLLRQLLPADGLSGYFDFSNNEYVAGGANIALSDLLTVTRSSTAQGVDKQGNIVTYPANTPRFHLVESLKKYGLTLGDNKRNHFLNSNTPVTQTMIIDEGTDRRWFLHIECVGSGSVTVSGAFSGVATQGSPLTFKNTTTTPITITATVSGQLSYVGVSKVTSPYGIEPTRVATGAVAATKIQDVTVFKADLLNTIYSANKEATIFMRLVRFDGGNDALTPLGIAKHVELLRAFSSVSIGGYVAWLDLAAGQEAALLSVKKQKDGAIISESPKIGVSWKKDNLAVFRLNKTKASVFLNGNKTTLENSNSTEVSPILSGLPSLLTPTQSDLISPNSVITHMVVYNKELSDAEISAISDIINK